MLDLSKTLFKITKVYFFFVITYSTIYTWIPLPHHQSWFHITRKKKVIVSNTVTLDASFFFSAQPGSDLGWKLEVCSANMIQVVHESIWRSVQQMWYKLFMNQSGKRPFYNSLSQNLYQQYVSNTATTKILTLVQWRKTGQCGLQVLDGWQCCLEAQKLVS